MMGTQIGPGGNRLRMALWGAATAVMLVPLIAMQFTSEVNWTALDFAFFAVLVGGIGGSYELLARRSGNTSYRVAAALALAATFLLVWINGAVGIIGDEDNDANLMFGGVIAVALVGAILGRFRPPGMATAMAAAAAVQLAVGVIALVGQMGVGAPIWPKDVIVLTLFFTGMWSLSAALFRTAGRRRTAAA